MCGDSWRLNNSKESGPRRPLSKQPVCTCDCLVVKKILREERKEEMKKNSEERN